MRKLWYDCVNLVEAERGPGNLSVLDFFFFFFNSN